jgi:cytoskeletal protein RodZ
MLNSIFHWKRTATALLTLFMAFVLCGGPQLALAQQPATPQTQQQPDQQATTPAAQPSNATQQPDAAQQPGQPSQSETSVQQQQQQPSPGMVDPSKGPLTPVPSTTPDQQPTVQPQDLPDAPSATQTQQTTDQQETPAQRAPRPRSTQPVGVGTAQQAPTAGGAASKPAGAAIAPAKQKQYRSLLIKIGAIAAGGAAIGTVYALSRGTKSLPPGAPGR